MRQLEDFLKDISINPIFRLIGRRIEKKHFNQDPILIVASPRSGTTLLLSILDSYKNIYSIPEQTYAFARWKYKKGKLYPHRIDRMYREFIKNQIPDISNRWCEKTPRHIKNLGNIIKYMPSAKVIHIVRDGRDVITSKHPKHRPDEYWVSIKRWVTDVNYGLEFYDHPNLLTLKYEDLINNFDEKIKIISSFLNESYVPTRDDWLKKTSLKKSKHWKDPVQQIHGRAIGRWKNEIHKKRIDELMDDPTAVKLLKKFGYING